MRGYTLLKMLSGVISLLMDYPQGLRILLGQVPAPDAGELYGIWRTVGGAADNTRVKTSRTAYEADIAISKAESFDEIIKNAGGWGHITAVTKQYKERYAVTWEIVAMAVSLPGSRVDGATYEDIAEYCGVSRPTVTKALGRFSTELATAILNMPV